MNNTKTIGVSTIRKEAWDKVTGAAKYNGDTLTPETLHGRILTSTHAHAVIKSIHIQEALKSKGVQAIITGEYTPILVGSIINDRPPIAKDKVRYFGEPVAVVVANTEQEAMKALKLIKVEYEPLPIVNSISDAIKPEAHLVHENLEYYYCPDTRVYPVAHTNIADHVKIRKGNMEIGWRDSDIVIESEFFLPQTDHLAMETRNSNVQILPNQNTIIHTSTQGPFAVREEISTQYHGSEGNVIVRVPLVGGGFGGKASVQMEFLAYLASSAVGGRMVRMASPREEDISTWPSNIGTKAKLKLGATKDGKITALECLYYVDCGAYTGTGPRMAKSIAINCSGPYNIENIHCDSYSIYTNHCYVTSYRGFGHVQLTFPIERMIDKLALALDMDPFDMRMKNIIMEGDTSPTQAKITLSNVGNLKACLSKLKETINWEEGQLIKTETDTIISKGISCFWKCPDSPTNAISGVVLTLNADGSINLNFGATEIGPGMKTTLSQILAEKMQMDINDVHVFMDVDTQVSPKHWKTVASMTTFMAGNAVINAADDLIRQLKELGAVALKCSVDDLDIGEQRVFSKDDPSKFIGFKDLVHGYKYPNGEAIYGQMIARGNYIMKQLTKLDRETGKGKPAVSWSVGAQAVEIEYNPKNYSYRLRKAATIIDIGKAINPKAAKGVIMGGMSMGLGLATREEFVYNSDGILENTSLRTYKLLRFGENPEYIVDFVETPDTNAPFGVRGIAEHGILGIPSALANALSLAAEAEFDTLPISPESIWKIKAGGNYDTF